jgi:putative transposase
MSKYAGAGASPAMPLQEIARRRAEGVLITAAGIASAEETMEWAMRAGVERARQLMELEVSERAGELYGRWDGRQGYRNGSAPGYVVVGGRKVKLDRPRLSDADGRELPLQTYAALQSPASLDRTALGKVMEGVAQRGVRRGLQRDQPLPEETVTYGASKSSISRRWISGTAETLAAQAERRLDDQRYVALLLDGKGFGDHLLVTALGLDAQGRKHILGVWEGDSENTEVCTAGLQGLMDRGLDVRRGLLVVIDGGKGLAAAVRALWGDVAVVARCRVHKRRNILKQLPKSEHRWVTRALEQAWRNPDAEQAHTDLSALVEELEPKWPEAAASLREGLAETLTCQRLGLPPELLTALGSTNLIESVFSTTGSLCRRVCRWRSGTQAIRWATMALVQAETGFGRAASPEAMAVLARAIAERLDEQSPVALAS